MKGFDPSVTDSTVKRVFEEQPRQENWSEDLHSLLSPSIQARPLHLPGILNIKRRLNTEVQYFWARDREGSNPNHQRVGELRAQGFDFAVSDPACKHDKDCKCDVIMANESTVKSKAEIRNGDLVLLKVAKDIWRGIRKQQQLDALHQTNPRATGERAVMSTLNSLPGVQTTSLQDMQIADIQSHRTYDDGATTVEERLSGNTTRVKGAK